MRLTDAQKYTWLHCTYGDSTQSAAAVHERLPDYAGLPANLARQLYRLRSLWTCSSYVPPSPRPAARCSWSKSRERMHQTKCVLIECAVFTSYKFSRQCQDERVGPRISTEICFYHQLLRMALWPVPISSEIVNQFRHLARLLGGVISPSQGLYLHRTAQRRKNKINIHALSGIWTRDPRIQAAKTHVLDCAATEIWLCFLLFGETSTSALSS
jgi:hypothetical protein